MWTGHPRTTKLHFVVCAMLRYGVIQVERERYRFVVAVVDGIVVVFRRESEQYSIVNNKCEFFNGVVILRKERGRDPVVSADGRAKTILPSYILGT